MISLLINLTVAFAEPPIQPQSPALREGVLFIEGPIGSHIYDYLSYERGRLQSVQWVSLNSYGGDHSWSLEIARVIRELGLSTRIARGSVCASACVYLFASGQQRQIADESWLGFHGARPSRNLLPTFLGLCGQVPDIAQASDKCLNFIEQWTSVTREATLQAFTHLESFGVSPELRGYYLSLPDEEDWLARFNLFRKPDLVISAQEALRLNFATQLSNP